MWNTDGVEPTTGIEYYELDADVYGNSRFMIHWVSLPFTGGLTFDTVKELSGMRKYRGKRFGGGLTSNADAYSAIRQAAANLITYHFGMAIHYLGGGVVQLIDGETVITSTYEEATNYLIDLAVEAGELTR